MELTDKQFKERIFNYDSNQFLGAKPTIVDLYTDWCVACRALSPSLDRLAEKLQGRVDIMKVNISRADELTSALGIQSVPTLLFFKPGVSGPTQTLVGASASKIEEEASSLV